MAKTRTGGKGAAAKASKPKKIGKADQNWMNMFERLKRFKSIHGHTHVSESNDDFIPGPFEDIFGGGSKRGREPCDPNLHALVKWVERQRAAKKSGAIRLDRMELLDGIDFYWNSKDYIWDQHYAAVVSIMKEAGHDAADMPSFKSELTKENEMYSEYMAWAEEQRLRYALYKKNYHTTITERRIDKLNAIGFTWKEESYQKKADKANYRHIMRNFKYQYEADELWDTIKKAEKEHKETGKPIIPRLGTRLIGKEPDGTLFLLYRDMLEEHEKKGNSIICFGLDNVSSA